uniref:Uncharacterized protein n=1 Tax=Neisseria meningitidis alpha522 TaxID=996307 RepID=I4E3X1_NEIME|nr:hypothetical protein NMALPHA522_0494 [Neisseria meningitidis alpha522]
MIWWKDRTVEESVQKSRLKNVQTAFFNIRPIL